MAEAATKDAAAAASKKRSTTAAEAPTEDATAAASNKRSAKAAGAATEDTTAAASKSTKAAGAATTENATAAVNFKIRKYGATSSYGVISNSGGKDHQILAIAKKGIGGDVLERLAKKAKKSLEMGANVAETRLLVKLKLSTL